MKTIDLPRPALPVPESAALSRAAPSLAAAASGPEGVGRGFFDGLAWTYRNGFDRVLAPLPAAAWHSPQEQGWQRIKQNATREVWRARIDGAVYYLKYYGHNWTDTLKRLVREPACAAEWNGGIYALRTEIPAVRPAGFTVDLRRGERRYALLVTEALEPSYPLNEYWLVLQSERNLRRRRADTAKLTERLAEMIARAHQAGFQHLDMHAANILVHSAAPGEPRTFFVDLHSTRRGVPISDRAVARNLAQLNQWFRRHSTVADRLRFLRAYLRWRNEYEHAFELGRPLGLSFRQLVRALARRAERHARQLWAQRDRRLRRDGHYFTRLRLAGGWRGMAVVRCKQPLEESRASGLVLERSWWRAQLADPLRWFREGGTDCKDSHSALVTRAVLSHADGNLPVIVKRPRARNWRRRVRHLFAPSRSARGWSIGHALLHRGIATARPLAVLERRFGPVVLDSVLATEALPGAEDLQCHLRAAHAALSRSDWRRHKDALCALVVRQVRRLEDCGCYHRDCKAENLLVVRFPRRMLLWVDMDGLSLVRGPSRRQRLRSLVRLQVSLLDVPGLTRTDRVRFLKSYCARFGADRNEWRSLWRQLVPAVDKKRRARQRRAAWKLKHYGRT